MNNVKVMTLSQRRKENAQSAAASLIFASILFLGHTLTHPEPDPKVVMAEEAKAIRCIPEDENTTCVMKRSQGQLVTEKHTNLSDKERLSRLELINPIDRY